MVDHSAHAPDAAPTPGEPAAMEAHAGHGALGGALGPYPLNRESSGTAWQPDSSGHSGLMGSGGEWTLMGHGVLNLVYDHQGGRRGDDKAFASGMLMGMARRPLGNGTLQLKAMVSPDPLMGKSGYPLLLASGETANGEDHLSTASTRMTSSWSCRRRCRRPSGRRAVSSCTPGCRASRRSGRRRSSREAILESPEAPISTMARFDAHQLWRGDGGRGVSTGSSLSLAGSTAASPTSTAGTSRPASSIRPPRGCRGTRPIRCRCKAAGRFIEPEQLEPGVDQSRWSASALFARDIAPEWKLAGTLAWGRKSVKHHGEWLNDDAMSPRPRSSTALDDVRAWRDDRNRELVEGEGDEEHGTAHRVGKISAGAVRDFRLAKHLSLGVGGLAAKLRARSAGAAVRRP